MTENSSTAATLTGKTVLISGGSRGIGHSIAVRLGEAGANVVLIAKTDQPHPSLPGTVHTAVEDIEAAGGAGLAVVGDIRNDDDVAAAVEAAVERFGGIDVVVNNASAIDLSPAEQQDMKRYDLMQDINARGSFALSAAAIPHLRASAQQQGWTPKVVTLSPPVNLDPKWFAKHLGYTMSKYAMSMTTIGLAAEMADAGVEVNSLWPVTLIETAALRNIPGGEKLARGARKPQIVADAAYALISGTARLGSGGFLTDEQVLTEAGVTDFSDYAVEPGAELIPDIFL
ncbi:NAD(P)-dependent oxidoreductase [Nesterenkonia sp. MY13]|uniref:NAD(P)-dependent oxidoreductase n=1 Tax=Nesterenkonia sedimenti TaxID=1463632 RepID=A0A7X8YD12_9MICC|nr:NAD(P)-dependent oxidoreductase [Nesterenkonia sedimenti]NLS09129.1 NAD(P)-dependent oxidoreductase [Nesterenkonia sedimenti]